ncbi:MAG: cyclic nucleotide-binding domain-containing protein [Acidobacteriota bacterium]
MATPQPFRDYIVKFREGDRIYSTGDPGTEMYIIQSGSVEIFKEIKGQRVHLALMEKGDFFGEMALIQSAPYSACAEARSPCELVEIDSTLFDKMIKGNIEIAVRMLRKLSIRLREANLRVERLAAGLPEAEGAAAMPAQAGGSVQETVTPGETRTAAEEPSASSAPSTQPATTPPASKESRKRARPARRPQGCHAYFLTEEGEEAFHLVGPRAVIGRYDPVTGLKPEVDLSPLDLNRSVSRHHARLTHENGVYLVTEEVGALNGTYINGQKLISGKPCRLKADDVLNLGMVKLIFKEV